MSHVAVWTDANDRVKRKHFHPDEVDTSDAAIILDRNDIPEYPDVEDWVLVEQFYTDSDGFYYETNDPLDGLDFSDSEKQELYDAFNHNDISKARTVVENALQK